MIVVLIYVCPHRLRQMKRHLDTFSCVAIYTVYVKVHKKTSLVGRSSLCLQVGNALSHAIATLPEEKVIKVQIVGRIIFHGLLIFCTKKPALSGLIIEL